MDGAIRQAQVADGRFVSGEFGDGSLVVVVVDGRFLRLFLIWGGAPESGIGDQVDKVVGPFPTGGTFEYGPFWIMAAMDTAVVTKMGAPLIICHVCLPGLFLYLDQTVRNVEAYR